MQTCEKCLEQIHPQALKCKWCRSKTPYYWSERKKASNPHLFGSARNDKIFDKVFWVIGISLGLWWMWAISN